MLLAHNHFAERIRNHAVVPNSYAARCTSLLQMIGNMRATIHSHARRASKHPRLLFTLIKSEFIAIGFVLLAINAWSNTWDTDQQQLFISPFRVETSKPDSFSSTDVNMVSASQVVLAPKSGKNDLRNFVPHNLRPHTTEDFNCSNAHINALSIVDGDHVTVNIDKPKLLLQPSVCMTSFAPATFWATLPTFGKALKLDFVNNAHADRYSYNVSLSTKGASENTIRASLVFHLQGNADVDK